MISAWTEGMKYKGKCEDCGDEYQSSSDQYEVSWDMSKLEDILGAIDAEDTDGRNASLTAAFRALTKTDRGDIIAPEGKKTPKYVTNPFTDEKVPVYSEAEKELLEELYEIEDQIHEVDEWPVGEPDGAERAELMRDIEKLDESYNYIKKKLDKARDESGWSDIREKQKKLAVKKEKKKKKVKKQKDAAKVKEEKRQADLQAERQKSIDAMPDDLKQVADDLFN